MGAKGEQRGTWWWLSWYHPTALLKVGDSEAMDAHACKGVVCC